MGRSVTRPTESYAEGIVGINRRSLLKAAGGVALFGSIPGQAATAATDANGATVYVKHQDRFYALSAADGSEQWSVEQEGTDSSPTVVDGTVYVGGPDWNILALDATDGSQQWSFDVGGHVFASPTVVDGTVYIGNQSQFVYAIDAADGTEEWSFRTFGAVRSSPDVVGGTVYVGNERGDVFALDAADGESQWEVSIGPGVRDSMTVWNGTVYVGGDDGNIYALDATDGSEKWIFETGDLEEYPSGLTVVDDTIYVSIPTTTVPAGGTLYAIDISDGSERWSFNTGDIDSAPTVVDGTVYVGTSEGGPDSTEFPVYALDAADGSEQWSFTGAAANVYTPTVFDGTVYFVSGVSVYALDTSDGSKQWEFETEEGFASAAPTVVENPQDGHSADSRVNLGTLGHHHVWAQRAVALTAAFTIDPENPTAGDDVTFDAGQSTGNIETYEWAIPTADGFPTGGDTVTHAFAEGGEYEVTLIVTDSSGESDSTTETITVEGSADEQTETDTTTEQETTTESDEATATTTESDETTATTTETDQATATITETDEATATATETDQETTTDQQTETSADSTEEAETINIGVPGFGIPAPLAALAGAGYLLKRRLTDQDEDT